MLKSKWCILLLFLILGLGIYSTSLNNGFIFSDHYLIAENCLIRSSSFTPYYFLGHISQDVKGAFRPLFMLSYNLSYSFSNYNTLGYRIFNILLHALSAFFLYRILCLFFKEPDSKIALLLSIFFLVHPINLDAVVHIMARSTLLFSFFILLSFHFFIFVRYFIYYSSYARFKKFWIRRVFWRRFIQFIIWDIYRRSIKKIYILFNVFFRTFCYYNFFMDF